MNKAFFEKALNAPRTLAPDTMSKSEKKPKIETVAEKRVLQDETRTIEIHHVTGLPRRRHADGVFPKEKTRARGHVNPPADSGAESAGGRHDGLPRKHGAAEAEPDRIPPVHSLNPDRLATKADILKSLGSNQGLTGQGRAVNHMRTQEEKGRRFGCSTSGTKPSSSPTHGMRGRRGCWRLGFESLATTSAGFAFLWGNGTTRWAAI